jgi:hypothetical protein
MNEIAKFKTSPIVSADKQALSEMVSSYLKELAFNGGEPLNDLALCRKYMFLLEELEKGIKEYVIKELEKQDNSEAIILGTNMKVVETGVKYDYSASKPWAEQKFKLDDESKKLKDIEALAKSLKGKMIMVDEVTGETFEYFPPAKTSSTSIRVTIQ